MKLAALLALLPICLCSCSRVQTAPTPPVNQDLIQAEIKSIGDWINAKAYSGIVGKIEEDPYYDSVQRHTSTPRRKGYTDSPQLNFVSLESRTVFIGEKGPIAFDYHLELENGALILTKLDMESPTRRGSVLPEYLATRAADSSTEWKVVGIRDLN